MAYDTFQRPTGIDWGNSDRTYGVVKFGDDNQQVVLFYTRSVLNPAKSLDLGHRHYDNQTWVKMHPPGERLNVIDRPVQENDKHRFPHQWNSFLQNKTQVPDGTPIDLLFPNNPAVADGLKACSVYTIQQCAQLSENAMQTIGMGAVEWKNMAVRYLDNANSGSAFLKLQAEVASKDQEIKLLNRKFDKLLEQYNDIMSRLKSPNAGNPANWAAAGHDPSMERLVANHPSQEMRPSAKRAGPPEDELDQANIIKQVTEENMPTIDVMKDQVGDEIFAPPAKKKGK